MSIKITMEFETIGEAIAALKHVSGQTFEAVDPVPNSGGGRYGAPEFFKDEKPAKKTKSKKSSKKKKEKEDTGGTSIDDVRTSLSACLDAAGRDVTVQILKDHKAEKLTDLDESEYESFVKACDAAVAEVTGN